MEPLSVVDVCQIPAHLPTPLLSIFVLCSRGLDLPAGRDTAELWVGGAEAGAGDNILDANILGFKLAEVLVFILGIPALLVVPLFWSAFREVHLPTVLLERVCTAIVGLSGQPVGVVPLGSIIPYPDVIIVVVPGTPGTDPGARLVREHLPRQIEERRVLFLARDRGQEPARHTAPCIRHQPGVLDTTNCLPALGFCSVRRRDDLVAALEPAAPLHERLSRAVVGHQAAGGPNSGFVNAAVTDAEDGWRDAGLVAS
mmetsp:Transcript_30359/g.46706  ORF Transcript_30359/g.46706 Transcript_30359/m.46706 type:complete len:256 (-) Transcript_30359:1140-1907(-)